MSTLKAGVSSPRGIGGWLILPVLGSVLAPFKILVGRSANIGPLIQIFDAAGNFERTWLQEALQALEAQQENRKKPTSRSAGCRPSLCGMRTLLCFFGLLVIRTGPALAMDDLARERFQVKHDTIACRKDDDLSKAISFIVQKDSEAMRKFLVPKFMAGECTSLPEGQKVFIEQGGILSHPCVRVRGEVECYFVPNGFIEPIQ